MLPRGNLSTPHVSASPTRLPHSFFLFNNHVTHGYRLFASRKRVIIFPILWVIYLSFPLTSQFELGRGQATCLSFAFYAPACIRSLAAPFLLSLWHADVPLHAVIILTSPSFYSAGCASQLTCLPSPSTEPAWVGRSYFKRGLLGYFRMRGS